MLENRLQAVINDPRIEQLVSKIESEKDLPQYLKDKLQTLPNNPLEADYVMKAVESGNDKEINIALNTLSEDEIKQFSAIEIGRFVHAVEVHVMGHTNDDGSYKSTPNTVECRIPNFIEADKLRKLMVKRDTHIKSWTKATDAKVKDKEMKGFGQTIGDLTNTALEISGLNLEALSEWEKALVISQVLGTANNAFLGAMGKL